MKRVAILSHGLSDGGAERVASILANGLDAKKYNVLFIAVYCSDKVYKLNKNVKYKSIQCDTKNKVLKLLNRAKKISDEVKKFEADIIISFIINESFYTAFVKSIPIVYSLRIDPHIVMKKKLDRYLCPILYSKAKAIVFQTNEAKKIFNQNVRNKGIVIGNPLSDELPYWNENQHDNSIITACRLSEQKNIPMLIMAFEKFSRDHPEYELKIYGDGPLLEELELLVKEKKICDKVKFMGYRKDIHNEIAKSGIFALTSNFEGLSNSMLEAMAIGIPVICTDCPPGGAAEYINDHENGILIKVGDVKELYTCLMELADNPDLCSQLSKKEILVREKLDRDKIIDKWISVIED